MATIRGHRPGDRSTITYLRDGKSRPPRPSWAPTRARRPPEPRRSPRPTGEAADRSSGPDLRQRAGRDARGSRSSPGGSPRRRCLGDPCRTVTSGAAARRGRGRRPPAPRGRRSSPSSQTQVSSIRRGASRATKRAVHAHAGLASRADPVAPAHARRPGRTSCRGAAATTSSRAARASVQAAYTCSGGAAHVLGHRDLGGRRGAHRRPPRRWVRRAGEPGQLAGPERAGAVQPGLGVVEPVALEVHGDGAALLGAADQAGALEDARGA